MTSVKKINNPILLAKIGAPHGVQGQLRVTSFTDDPMALGDYGTLFSRDGQPFSISKARPAKNVLVVTFKEVQTREDAEKLRGLELYIERDALPENSDANEFYADDLIGMHVTDTNNTIIGLIRAVPNFGAGDLLEIAPGNEGGRFSSNTWYLSFTKDNVPEIDMKENRVTIIKPDEISERDGGGDE